MVFLLSHDGSGVSHSHNWICMSDCSLTFLTRTDLTYFWEICRDVYLALSRSNISRNTNICPPSPPSTFCREKELRSLSFI